MDTIENIMRELVIVLIDDFCSDDARRALAIYHRKTPAEIRTDARDFAKNPNCGNNRFITYLFAFKRKGVVIGMGMATKVSKKYIVYDYVAFDDMYEKYSTLYALFFDFIKDYFQNDSDHIEHFVAEIRAEHEDVENLRFIYSLYRYGFKCVMQKYTTLRLGDAPGTSFATYLYIDPPSPDNDIDKDSFCNIIEAIYFDYYCEWYKNVYSDERKKDQYRQEARQAYKELRHALRKKKRIPLTSPILKKPDCTDEHPVFKTIRVLLYIWPFVYIFLVRSHDVKADSMDIMYVIIPLYLFEICHRKGSSILYILKYLASLFTSHEDIS